MPWGRKKDAFITIGYTNWKDATGGKSVVFPIHEHSEVSVTVFSYLSTMIDMHHCSGKCTDTQACCLDDVEED